MNYELGNHGVNQRDLSSAPYAAGCERFVYAAKNKTMRMNYYSAPEDAMESPALMAPWAKLALEAAMKAGRFKPAPKRATQPKAPPRRKAGVKAG